MGLGLAGVQQELAASVRAQVLACAQGDRASRDVAPCIDGHVRPDADGGASLGAAAVNARVAAAPADGFGLVSGHRSGVMLPLALSPTLPATGSILQSRLC